MNRLARQWPLLALVIVAIAYFVMPAKAEAACMSWVAEQWEDEGGPVLTAAACAREDERVFLSLTCFAGQIGLRYDLALGAERSPELDEQALVTFAVDEGRQVLQMSHQAMDGMFATDILADSPLVGMLSSGSTLSIRDDAGLYPSRIFSLAGSSAAIGALLEACN